MAMVHRYERLTDRSEFEFGWLTFGCLLGLGYLTTGGSVTIRAVLPAWFAYLWAAAFLLGGLTGIPSVVWTFSSDRQRYFWGLVGSRAGHMLHAAAVSTLGIVVVQAWRERPGTPFPVLGIALAVVWMGIVLRRSVRVTQIIKSMKASVTSRSEGSDGQ